MKRNPPAEDDNLLSKRGLRTTLAAFLVPGASELGATIADQVRLVRWKRAVRILKKAKEFADREGLKKRDVPTKFLIPFIESCSAEDDELMEERWARLLATSAGSFDATKQMLMNCLACMGRQEAELLRRFAVAEHSENAPFMSALRANSAIDGSWVWQKWLEILDSTDQKKAFEIGSKSVFQHAFERGALPFMFSVDTRSLGNDGSSFCLPVAVHQKALYNLKNLNLISGEVIDERFYKTADTSVSEKPLVSTLRFQFMWFQLTALGEDFLRSCEGGIPKAPAHLNSSHWAEFFDVDLKKSRPPKKTKGAQPSGAQRSKR